MHKGKKSVAKRFCMRYAIFVCSTEHVLSDSSQNKSNWNQRKRNIYKNKNEIQSRKRSQQFFLFSLCELATHYTHTVVYEHLEYERSDEYEIYKHLWLFERNGNKQKQQKKKIYSEYKQTDLVCASVQM